MTIYDARSKLYVQNTKAHSAKAAHRNSIPNIVNQEFYEARISKVHSLHFQGSFAHG